MIFQSFYYMLFVRLMLSVVFILKKMAALKIHTAIFALWNNEIDESNIFKKL